jgi:hypothetical protein
VAIHRLCCPVATTGNRTWRNYAAEIETDYPNRQACWLQTLPELWIACLQGKHQGMASPAGRSIRPSAVNTLIKGYSQRNLYFHTCFLTGNNRQLALAESAP